MSQLDKLIARIESLDRNLRFDEIEKVLVGLGYKKTAPKSGSSHYTFRKPGVLPITVPKHEPIKVPYVLKVKQILESEVSKHENA